MDDYDAKVTNESMFDELRIYVKVLDTEWRFSVRVGGKPMRPKELARVLAAPAVLVSKSPTLSQGKQVGSPKIAFPSEGTGVRKSRS